MLYLSFLSTVILALLYSLVTPTPFILQITILIINSPRYQSSYAGMGCRCIVYKCRKSKLKERTMFRFPSNLERRTKWFNAVKMKKCAANELPTQSKIIGGNTGNYRRKSWKAIFKHRWIPSSFHSFIGIYRRDYWRNVHFLAGNSQVFLGNFR